MALEGSLKDFGLADILQLIYFQRKTGVLTLEGNMDRVKLLFIEGNISSAESKRRIEDNRLGKILLKKGLIKEADLNTALKEQRTTGGKLGKILVKKELVKQETISDPRDKEFPFTIDTQHLLMEGLRILDEWSLIKGKLTLDTVFIKKTESPSNLTEEEGEILTYVDGENDVSTIIDLSPKDNARATTTLLSLMEKGVIEAAAEAAPVTATELIPEVKKPLPILNYLPYLAIIVSLLVSFSVVSIQQAHVLKEFKAAKSLEDLRFRLEIYRLEHSEYPHSLNLISDSNDPWGRPYFYRISDNLFNLVSAGHDGKEGTEDDIF
jgi:hypothetical protein